MKQRIQVEKTIKGHRYRKSKSVETNLKGVQLKAFILNIKMELLKEIDLEALDTEKIRDFTIRELADWHFKNSSIEQTTIDWYNDYLKRIVAWFGNKKAATIEDEDVRTFFRFLDKEISDRTKKPLSQKTKKHYRTALSALLQILVDKRYMDHNPVNCITVKVPRKSLNGKFYEPGEIKECIDLLIKHSDTMHLLLFSLSVMGGLRPSEVRALTWEKIDFKNHTITIDSALVKSNVGDILKPTKTEDIRILPIIDFVYTLLQLHKEDEILKKKRLKIRKDIEKCYVFTNKNYNFIYANMFRGFWVRFCKKHGIKYVYPYGLRHTTATLLAFNNTPMPNIARQLGHASTKTTEVYVHVVDEAQQQIQKTLESAISPKLFAIN